MKKFAFLALASGLALAAAAPADATITIAYSVNGGAVTVLATDTATPGSATFTNTSGGFFFNVGATGAPVNSNPFDLLTQTLNIRQVSGTPTTLNVFVTEQGLPTLNSGALMSSFTSNTLLNNTTRITSFYSPTNALYGGTQLQTNNFTSPGAFEGINTVTAAGPFSTTIRYDISFGAGTGNFNGTANITAVPEPATWGMMILGFGLMGAAVRRRKTTVAFA